MKKQLIQFSLVLLCLLFLSCDDKVDGKASDSIKLSKNKLSFSNESGVETITTKSDFWWFLEIKDDGKYVSFKEEIVDLGSEDFEFVGEWYHIKRIGRDIEISVLENTTGKPRNLHISLQAGNWFGSSIYVNQEG